MQLQPARVRGVDGEAQRSTARAPPLHTGEGEAERASDARPASCRVHRTTARPRTVGERAMMFTTLETFPGLGDRHEEATPVDRLRTARAGTATTRAAGRHGARGPRAFPAC